MCVVRGEAGNLEEVTSKVDEGQGCTFARDRTQGISDLDTVFALIACAQGAQAKERVSSSRHILAVELPLVAQRQCPHGFHCERRRSSGCGDLVLRVAEDGWRSGTGQSDQIQFEADV